MTPVINDIAQSVIIVIYVFALISGLGALAAIRYDAPYRVFRAAVMMGSYIVCLMTFRTWRGGLRADIKHACFFVTMVSTMASAAMVVLNVEYLIDRTGDGIGFWGAFRWLSSHLGAGLAAVGFHAVVRSASFNCRELFK